MTIVAPIVKNEASAFQAFTAKYGVKVNAVDQPSSVAGSSIETQEKTRAVTDDLIATSNYSQLQQFAGQGYLERYVPQAAGLYPSSAEIKGYAYPVGNSDAAIAWNTKTTPPAVQKQLETDPYQALLSPSLKGKIVLLDAGGGGSGMAWFSNLVYNVKGYGWPYLEKLAAQHPAITTTVETIASEVEGGTYDVTNFGSIGALGPAAANGAPIRFVIPSPASATQFEQAIIKGAPHPAAARLFQEWAASLPGQEAITKGEAFTSQAKGWKDETTFMSKLSWFKLPSQTYLSWQTDPRLSGTKLEAFVNKWNKVFHYSAATPGS